VEKWFHDEHLRTYAHNRPDEPIDVVNLRLQAKVIFPTEVEPENLVSSEIKAAKTDEHKKRKAYFGKEFGWLESPILGLSDLAAEKMKGPLIVELYDTTCVIPPYAKAKLGKWGAIEITVMS
jgi:N-methylhydantoinase A